MGIYNENYATTNIENESVYILQEPYVSNDGIYVPLSPYVKKGTCSHYKCVMTKELVIQAYNKFINGNKVQRRYKGGWKRK